MVLNGVVMNISNEGIAITRRFFEAIERLRAMKKIRGLQTFTKKHGINYWNLCTVRDNADKSVLKPEIIAFLSRDYGVSTQWLLLGTGEFMISNSENEP